jgi:glutamine synthetase
MSAIRVIAPPTCPPSATRLEIRLPGSDVVSHYAIAVLLGCGMLGVDEAMPLTMQSNIRGEPLPTDLKSAVDKFSSPNSIARKVMGNAFVDFYGATRMHEVFKPPSSFYTS